ncbi:MAG TPA: vitamin B12-dependent ribonucleotide reductase, partial [Actinomycetota bacterium]
PDIRFATSLVDYVFRRLALDHLPIEQREALGIRSIDERKETAAAEAAEKLGTTVEEVVAAVKAEAPPKLPIVGSSGVPQAQAADAPLCYTCGSKMLPAGSCYVCPSCGSTSGCS